MAQPLTVLFMPESAYGPTNNCIGIGDILRKRGHRVVFAAEASWKGRLEPLGFVEDLVDLAPPPAARRPRAGRRPVLEGLHPGHVAGVPQADGRAARDVHAADLAGADRRRAVLRAAAARDHRPPAARRDRRGQRRLVPGADDVGRAVRPDHVVQPARDARPGHPAGLLRPAVRRPIRVGVVPRRSTTGPIARCGRRSTSGAASRARRACPTSSSSTRRTRSTCTSIPRWPTTPTAGRSTRRGAASTRACAPTDAEVELPALLTDRPDGSALIYLSLGSLGCADVDADAATRRASSPTRPTGSSSPRARSTPTTSSRRTCGARSSCRRRS